MSAFTSRNSGYKGGVFLLFFATAAYLVGFGAPYWANVDIILLNMQGLTTTYHEGLWMLCVSAEYATASAVGCGNYGFSGFPSWFHVVRALTCLCTVGLIIACIYCLATNCCRSFPGPRSRVMEVLTICAGILGFVGCMVYVGLRNDTAAGASAVQAVFRISDAWTFSWGLYVAAIGSGLSFIAGIIIGVFNKPVEGIPNSGGLVMTTVPQPATYPAAYPQPQPQSGYDPYKAGYPASYPASHPAPY